MEYITIVGILIMVFANNSIFIFPSCIKFFMKLNAVFFDAFRFKEIPINGILMKKLINLALLAICYTHCSSPHNEVQTTHKYIDSATFEAVPLVIEGRLINHEPIFGPVFYSLVKVEKILKNVNEKTIADTILIDGHLGCVHLNQSDTTEVMYLARYDTVEGQARAQFYKIRHPYSVKDRNCE